MIRKIIHINSHKLWTRSVYFSLYSCLFVCKLSVSGFVCLKARLTFSMETYHGQDLCILIGWYINSDQSNIAWFKPAKSKSFSKAKKKRPLRELLQKQNFTSYYSAYKMVKTRSNPLTSVYHKKSMVRNSNARTRLSYNNCFLEYIVISSACVAHAFV